MKGSILGRDEASGDWIIRGDDGNRYSFGASEWKGAAPPAMQEQVDFDADGGRAKQVFSLKKAGGGAAAAANLGGLAGSINSALKDTSTPTPSGATFQSNPQGWFMQRPQVAAAILIIIGALVDNYLSLVSGQMNTALGAVQQMSQIFGAAGGNALFIQLGTFSLYLLLLAPLLAIYVLFKEFTATSSAQVKVLTGLAGVILPIAVPIVAGLLIKMGMPQSPFGGAGQGLNLLNIDLGFILVVGGGALMLANALGMVRSFGPTA
jgi:hypothetical protein